MTHWYSQRAYFLVAVPRRTAVATSVSVVINGETTAEFAGIDQPAVTAWMGDHIDGLQPPLQFELIAGGHSNLTFKVTDQRDEHYVFRRPPLHQVLASAHDMSREHKIMAALQGSAVPVPEVIGLCTDESVNERPFYVMRYVDGHVMRDLNQANKLSDEVKDHASQSLVDTLAAIHAVDIDAVGLTDLGRKEDYIARQLRRWMGQYDNSKTREIPAIQEVHDHLAAHIPDQQGASIVHGDYRLDNCMINDAGDVIAVLDWEICTLGDPLADIAQLITYWAEPADTMSALVATPTASPGFWSRQQVLEAYDVVSDRSLVDIDFYLAFANWKLACILEGVYSRYIGGAMGDKTPAGGTDGFVTSIDNLVARSAELASNVT